jgi:tripartite-type tricarboxylate transporter receptor subunit TctC
MKRHFLRLLLGVSAVLLSGWANAQAYPAKPVRVVVPFPPGGAMDTLTRTISLKAGEKLGQPIIVENRPGAGGIIGSDYVAKSPPDGYTLMMASNGTHSTGPAINPKLPYSVERDFSPIAYVARTASIMVVSADLPVKNLGEFIALLKANPGKYNYGSSGNGTNPHLSGELFKAQAGVFMTHVPYRGTGLVFTDMVSGQVHMLIDNFVTAQPHVKDGKLRVLGVTSLQRLSFMPDVPPLDEQGLKGYDTGNWFGIYGPKGMPADIIAKLNTAFNQAIQDPDTQKRLAFLGATPTGSTPEQLASLVAAETAKWTKLIRERNIVVH